MIVVKFCYKGFPQLAKLGYTQSGPIMNGGVMARGDAAVRYRTILRVHI